MLHQPYIAADTGPCSADIQNSYSNADITLVMFQELYPHDYTGPFTADSLGAFYPHSHCTEL